MLQAIEIADRSFERAKLRPDFVRKRISPGSCIPPIASITKAVAKATRMRIVDLEDIGIHYATTLAVWNENLMAASPGPAHDEIDEGFRRLWRMCLRYYEAGFLKRHVSDVQMVIGARHFRSAPILRQK